MLGAVGRQVHWQSEKRRLVRRSAESAIPAVRTRQLSNDNDYRDDAVGVKVVFVGFLEEMDGAETAGAREAFDGAQNGGDGRVSTCQRDIRRTARQAVIRRSGFDQCLGRCPTTSNIEQRFRSSIRTHWL